MIFEQGHNSISTSLDVIIVHNWNFTKGTTLKTRPPHRVLLSFSRMLIRFDDVLIPSLIQTFRRDHSPGHVKDEMVLSW